MVEREWCLVTQKTASQIRSETRWPPIVSSAALLRASNAISNQRALGVVFFVNCTASNTDLIYYTNYVGQAETLLDLAISFDSSVDEWLTTLYYGTVLNQNISAMTSLVTSENFSTTCRHWSDDEKAFMTKMWKEDLQTYLSDVIDEIRTEHVIKNLVQVKCVEVYLLQMQTTSRQLIAFLTHEASNQVRRV